MKELKPAYLTGDSYVDKFIIELLSQNLSGLDRKELFEAIFDNLEFAWKKTFLEILDHYATDDDIYNLASDIDDAITSILLGQEKYRPILALHGYHQNYLYDGNPGLSCYFPTYYTYVLHILGIENYSEELAASSNYPHAIPTNEHYQFGTTTYSFKDAGNNILHCEVNSQTLFTLQRLDMIDNSYKPIANYVIEWISPEYTDLVAQILYYFHSLAIKTLDHSIVIFTRPDKQETYDFAPVDILEMDLGEITMCTKYHVREKNGPGPSKEA